MGSFHKIPLLLLLLVFLLSVFAAPLSSSAFISVGNQVVNERRLLQVKTPCSVDIENQNYSIITSQCNDPYPPEPCCSAFKELACPLAVQINDLTTDCADRMMSYIYTVGKYPNGLFASICRDDKDGLHCPASPPLPTPNVAPTPLFMPLLLLLLFPLLSNSHYLCFLHC